MPNLKSASPRGPRLWLDHELTGSNPVADARKAGNGKIVDDGQ